MKTIRLLKPHTHGSVKYPTGATLPPLEVKTANWLIDQGVGFDVTDEASATAAPTITRTPNPPVRRGCCGGRW